LLPAVVLAWALWIVGFAPASTRNAIKLARWQHAVSLNCYSIQQPESAREAATGTCYWVLTLLMEPSSPDVQRLEGRMELMTCNRLRLEPLLLRLR
jgi:hypothetical protein